MTNFEAAGHLFKHREEIARTLKAQENRIKIKHDPRIEDYETSYARDLKLLLEAIDVAGKALTKRS